MPIRQCILEFLLGASMRLRVSAINYVIGRWCCLRFVTEDTRDSLMNNEASLKRFEKYMPIRHADKTMYTRIFTGSQHAATSVRDQLCYWALVLLALCHRGYARQLNEQ